MKFASFKLADDDKPLHRLETVMINMAMVKMVLREQQTRLRIVFETPDDGDIIVELGREHLLNQFTDGLVEL